MAKGEMFGKLRAGTVDIVLGFKSNSAVRAFLYIAPLFKDGKSLKGQSRDALESWLAANAPGIDPDAVQTVSFTVMELANGLYGGTRGSARHAISGMVSGGALVQVAKGAKGRSPLFAVLPLPPPKEVG